ncbi:MAG: hypothetical protein IKD52_09590, partial [Exiguobacterium sp.]|nr:hypothetical protein [Exiguobacterium sp.]
MNHLIYFEREASVLYTGASRIQLETLPLPDSNNELEQMICSESIQTLYLSTYQIHDRNILEP